jgi:hypothetical protein
MISRLKTAGTDGAAGVERELLFDEELGVVATFCGSDFDDDRHVSLLAGEI